MAQGDQDMVLEGMDNWKQQHTVEDRYGNTIPSDEFLTSEFKNLSDVEQEYLRLYYSIK